MLHDISSIQDLGESPLHQAAVKGHEAVVKVLLSKGADINQADNNGTSPLLAAVGNVRVAVVILLLSSGANVNLADNKGKSPLHDAAMHWGDYSNRGALVAVLLSNGADINQVDNDGKKPIDVAKTQEIKGIFESPWFFAAKNGHLVLIQQGINDKIDVNCRDSKGRTAVSWATEKGHLQLVEYLITQHADLSIANVSTNEGFSYLIN